MNRTVPTANTLVTRTSTGYCAVDAIPVGHRVIDIRWEMRGGPCFGIFGVTDIQPKNRDGWSLGGVRTGFYGKQENILAVMGDFPFSNLWSSASPGLHFEQVP